MKKYKTVVIDPPWPIRLAPDMERILPGSSLHSHMNYENMTEEELRDFPIDDFAADRSMIFIWCTNSKLTTGRPCIQVALELLEHWGFRYRSILVWHKTHGFAIWIPFRGVTEFIIFGTRKLSKCPPYGQYSNVFNWPMTKHSEKPAGFYQMLRNCTPEPRIDIFARRAHPGFNGWGDEYAGDHGPLLPFLDEEGVA